MKRLLSCLVALILITAFSPLAFAYTLGSIPDNIQQRAEEYFASVKPSIIENPADWDYQSSENITSVVLSEGLLLQDLTLEYTDYNPTRLVHLVAPYSRPIFLFTIDVNDKSFWQFEYSLKYGDEDITMLSTGSSWELFGQARDRFKKLAGEKGITDEPNLFQIAGRYIFAASDQENEWALPVPMPDEVSEESWKSNQLWTSAQIIQTLKNFHSAYKPGYDGLRPDFIHKPDMNTNALLGFWWILIPLGIIVTGLVFWLIKRRKTSKKRGA